MTLVHKDHTLGSLKGVPTTLFFFNIPFTPTLIRASPPPPPTPAIRRKKYLLSKKVSSKASLVSSKASLKILEVNLHV